MTFTNRNTQPRDASNAEERAVTRDWISIPELRATIQGQVIAPEDEEYDQVRTSLYGDAGHRPAVIVRAASAADVVQAVALARSTGLELAVRSGGHSMAGHSSTDGGILLDLKGMRALEIDAATRTAWAEAGLTAGEYTAAVGAHGLATGFGDTASVGIGGITLGGGVGYLSRKYGLTIDNLLAAEVVTADGQILHVDAESHPDLFWALRGGGGNFGVVTRFQYRLHPVDAIFGGMLVLPATPEVIAGFAAAAEAAPEELTAIVAVMSAPPMPFLPAEAHGRPILMAFMAYAGDAADGERALAPFRALAQPLADLLKPMHYPELFPPEDFGDGHPSIAARTLFLDAIDRETAATVLERLQASDAMLHGFQFRVLGGAIARVPVDATAYAHRRSRIMVSIFAMYNQIEERERHEAWATGFAAAVRQAAAGAYVNFMGDGNGASPQDAYPGPTWERLAAVKALYDPTNLFRRNHNVPPAGKD